MTCGLIQTFISTSFSRSLNRAQVEMVDTIADNEIQYTVCPRSLDPFFKGGSNGSRLLGRTVHVFLHLCKLGYKNKESIGSGQEICCNLSIVQQILSRNKVKVIFKNLKIGS